MKRLVAAVALAAVSIHANAISVEGYTTGNRYRELNIVGQAGYIRGLIDGYFASPLYAKSDLPRTVHLGKCTEGMTVGQVKAIIDKYMNENPAEWAQTMSAIAFRAMLDACKAIGKPLD
jgi:hypothetical protein